MFERFVDVQSIYFPVKERYLVLLRGVKMSFYIVIQMCNQTTLYWFSTYWFRASYPFRPLIDSALIGSDVAKPV
ncbi:hypothetical protein Hanom_Chr09g00826711 [Helianthus anomalus]